MQVLQYESAAKAGIDVLMGAFDTEETEDDNDDDRPWLTTLAREAPTVNLRGKNVALSSLDSGLSGVVDKLVAIRANHYLVGEPHVCARRSSYTQQIIRERLTEMVNDPDSDLESGLEYFPEEGQFGYITDLDLANKAEEEEEAAEAAGEVSADDDTDFADVERSKFRRWG